jgi:hypothetical protein
MSSHNHISSKSETLTTNIKSPFIESLHFDIQNHKVRKRHINSRNAQAFSHHQIDCITKSQKTTKDGTPTKEGNNEVHNISISKNMSQTFDSLSNMSDILGQPALTYSKIYHQSKIHLFIFV